MGVGAVSKRFGRTSLCHMSVSDEAISGSFDKILNT